MQQLMKNRSSRVFRQASSKSWSTTWSVASAGTAVVVGVSKLLMVRAWVAPIAELMKSSNLPLIRDALHVIGDAAWALLRPDELRGNLSEQKHTNPNATSSMAAIRRRVANLRLHNRLAPSRTGRGM
jgi:hypothetical protein